MWEYFKNIFRKIRYKLHYDDVETKQLLMKILDQQYKFQSNISAKIDLLKLMLLEPNGLQNLHLRYELLGAPAQYEHLFWEMPSDSVCIDCGGNVGLFSDLIISQGCQVHMFEPNPFLFSKLSWKYRNEPLMHLYNSAVGIRNETVTFSLPENINDDFLFWSLSSVVKTDQIDKECITSKSKDYEVESIRLTEFIEKLLNEKISIYILKLDVEGSEFEIIDDIIEKQLYRNIAHIFCETHERFVVQGTEKLEKIKEKIASLGIENIYLDWI